MLCLSGAQDHKVSIAKGSSLKSAKKKNSQELVETHDTPMTLCQVGATDIFHPILHKLHMATVKNVQMELYPSTLIVVVI